MLQLTVGAEVKVRMPRGLNTRGVDGIHTMYTTSPEARFDGAVGVITEIDPNGPFGTAHFLVDFSRHDNPWVPWQAQWFREAWLELTGKPGVGDAPEDEAVTPPSRTGGPVHQ